MIVKTYFVFSIIFYTQLFWLAPVSTCHNLESPKKEVSEEGLSDPISLSLRHCLEC